MAGRPEFKPTPKQRRDVSIAAGAGVSHEEIAIGLGIAKMTLQKHFEHELSVGAYKRRQEVLNAMYDSAIGGNVAAQKAYAALSPKVAPTPAEPDQPLGKKDQANADARTAGVGTEWGTLLN